MMTVRELIILSMAAAVVFPPFAQAQQEVKGVQLRDEGLKVIEEKCLVCHNRQRIEATIRERENVERVMKRMEKKGVVLSEKDRNVIGHFLGQKIFKSKHIETGPNTELQSK